MESYHVVPDVHRFARYKPELCESCERVISHQIHRLTRAKRTEENNEDRGNYPPYASNFATCALCKFIWSLILSQNSQLSHRSDLAPKVLSTYSYAPRKVTPDQGSLDVSVVPYIGTFATGFRLTSRLDTSTPHTTIWRSNDPVNAISRLAVPRKWLRECQTDHKGCHRWSWAYDWICPTRLIDVSNATPRLVCPKSGVNPRYAALSHCWGNGQPLKTMKSNLVEHMLAIDLARLPKTFQDAITVARSLSLDYLWIDSLCIVQDDAKDWEREAANMAAIYESAEITIAAAWGLNGTAGCFHDHIPTFSVAAFDADTERWDQSPSAQLYMRVNPREDETLGRATLTTRKWTLQESLLTRRSLIFSEDQMYWTCASRNQCEDELVQGTEVAFNSWKGVLPYETGIDGRTTEHRHASWSTAVSNYGSRNLSFPSDKLAAFAGVTKAYQRILRDEPLVGLWRTNLVGGLGWYGGIGFKGRHTHDVGERRLDLEAIDSLNLPSWSWVKMQRGMTLNNRVVTNTLITIDSTNLTWEGVPLTSKISQASISGKGRLLSVLGFERSERTRYSTDNCQCHVGSIYIRGIGDERKQIQIERGFIDECVKELPDAMFCLLLHDVDIHSGKGAIRSLLLARHGSVATSSEYSRFGMADLVGLPENLVEATREQNFILT